MKVAYILSRFPLVTETFILREFDRVDAHPDASVELYALYPSSDEVVHRQALRWIERCHRASSRRAVAAALYWLFRAPRAVARIAAATVRDYARGPRMLGKSAVTVAIAFQYALQMRAAGITHVHAHFATYPALTAWVIRELTGIPYSVTPHAHDIFVSQLGLRTKLGSAAGVVAVSTYNAMFLQHFGADPRRLWRLSYGLDLTEHAFRPRSIPEHGPVDAVMVSSFKAYKGHRVLLEALARDSPTIRRVRVEFIGSGPMAHEIERLAETLGVADRCTFSGSRDEAYVRTCLARTHLLIQPSIVQPDGDTEGLPNSLIEGAAAGVSLVATRVTGIPDLIEDGVSGYLADPCSPADLQRAIERALSGRDESTRLQGEARRRVEERHDLDHLATALISRFRQAAAAASED